MRLVEWLYRSLRPMLNSRFFLLLSSLIIFLNPIAILPQLVSVITTPSVAGISVTMWVIFALIQGAVALEGVRMKRASFFYSMAISVVESVSILVIVLIRN